jgi:glycosyltransferase involved in cell wall biosynthesis
MMKVAFVVQRYGTEVNGGSEFLCRLIAERMSQYWDLEVLTTCAMDYTTWEDFYPPGLCEVNHVKVRRFRVDFPRSGLLFNQFSNLVYQGTASLEMQSRWVQEQGPYSSDFLRYLDAPENSYDVYFFFTYLYGLTLLGLPKVANRSILIPTAHDELPFHLPIFQPLFSQAQAYLFQTQEEQDLVLKKFNMTAPHGIVSTGVEVPSRIATEEFKSRYGEAIRGDYILYLGRIEEAKGCHELFRFFVQYRAENPQQSLQLILVGKTVMEIPKHPDIQHLGFVTEELKYAALALAQVLVVPSPYESLSLVTLEAWSIQTPVLVTKKSPVLQGQCERSGGGLLYETYEDFKTALDSILRSPSLRKQLGEKGADFVKDHYLWENVEKAYQSWAQRVGRPS